MPGANVVSDHAFLAAERATLERFSPELASYLADAELHDLEQPESDAIAVFKRSRATTLLVPSDRSGLGATALEAVRFQRAVGSFAPSLAIASNMHHFSMSMLVEYCRDAGEDEWEMVAALARESMLLASGFAEGRSGQGFNVTTLRARRVDDGYILNGTKKPCSLAYSMDVLTANAVIEEDGAEPELAIVIVPSGMPGIEREPFWSSEILAGAESHAVVLKDVVVPQYLVYPESTDPDDRHQTGGLIWFELLVTASYVGVASALVDRALRCGKGASLARAQLAVELESTMCAIERIALAVDEGDRSNALLARTLMVRYGAQGAIARAAAAAVELLGGMAFITSNDVAYLHAACQALGFHPPSRQSVADSLAGTLSGGELVLP